MGKGITAPSFYAAFGSKASLFGEAVEETITDGAGDLSASRFGEGR